MTDSRSSTGTLRSLVVWVVFALLMIFGVWQGIVLPLAFGVVSRLPLALLAFGVAIAVVLVDGASKYRALR